MRRNIARTCLLAALCCGLSGTSLAHPISLSSAIVDVKRDRIVADLQIMLEDLVLYHELKAGGDYQYSAEDLRSAAKKHEQFVMDYFTLRDANGEALKGKIEELDTSKIEAGGVRQTELMKKSVNYAISFPISQPQSFLTLTQTFGGPDAVLPAVMDLMLLQNGILMERPTQLTLGRPHSVKFDWDNPPTRAPRSLRDLRKMRDEQVQERLGIATYGGLYSFLYITRFEVRHEVLIPLLTLEQWLPIRRKNPDFLEVEEQAVARKDIKRFFREQSPVSINGQPVSAKLTRLNFFGLDINDFALNAEPRRVSVHQARAGVILSYPSRVTPRQVVIQWKAFSEYAPFLRTIVLVGNDAPSEQTFRVAEPTFEWAGKLISANVLAVPSLSASLGVKAATDVAKRLLTNVYRAFDFRDDGDVYDALATSVEGDLLRDLYLQTKRSLLMAEQGGALSHVTGVEVVKVLPSRKSASTFDVTWRVAGTVEHWGHVHKRVKDYEATLTIQRIEDAWKLKGVELLSEKRVSFETSIRGYDRD
ncbi:MAG: hypothetical protein CMJ64_12120 [Planctomycetaceae bacterium]|nr:hypothetical protein [Planctomycetaceae bacterium]